MSQISGTATVKHSDLIEYETVEQTYNHDRLISIENLQASLNKSTILPHINLLLQITNVH